MKQLLSLVALLWLTVSCIGGQAGKDGAEMADSAAAQPFVSDVREVTGRIGDGTSMHVVELITDSLDTLYIELNAARMMGGLVVGNRADVIYNSTPNGRVASLAINLSTLQHLWSRPNGDGTTTGLELDEGGRAITYDQPGAGYDAWELRGGRLILHAAGQTGRENSAFADTFDILQLTADTLVVGNDRGELVWTRDN